MSPKRLPGTQLESLRFVRRTYEAAPASASHKSFAHVGFLPLCEDLSGVRWSYQEEKGDCPVAGPLLLLQKHFPENHGVPSRHEDRLLQGLREAFQLRDHRSRVRRRVCGRPDQKGYAFRFHLVV